jgi:RND family efflux transporter MFP subunit
MEVAIAAEGAAHAAVASAKAQVVAANARVAEAKANIVHSETDVQVSQAKLDKANVFLNYTKITSPYDGVVTFRGFHRGDFIMSRDQGAQTPLLTVARTDLMRVVVKVADPDVPYVSVGDKATIEIGSIPNKQFVGQVSRMADSEDPKQKTMRVEIDLPNPDGLLREGMYGRRTTIELEPASGAMTVPSAALVGSSNGNEGKVYVVRDGKSYLAPIHIGQDNGRQMEVLSGLQPTDEVVVHYNGAIGDGTPVDAIAATETAKPEVPKAKTH